MSESSGVVIQLGKHRLNGRPANLLLGAMGAALEGHLPLTLSLAGWIAFIVYCSAAAVKSESRQSRAAHQMLLNGALLLLVVRVPGLRSRFLPQAAALAPAALAVQAAFFMVAAAIRSGREF